MENFYIPKSFTFQKVRIFGYSNKLVGSRLYSNLIFTSISQKRSEDNHLDDLISKLEAEEDQVNDSIMKAMKEQEKVNEYLSEIGMRI